jgi:Na+-transporting NADH:ubiquinone oxidoreductase subunit B
MGPEKTIAPAVKTPALKAPLIKWQKPMAGVLYALAAPTIASIYFFGWRSLALLAVVNLAGFLAEYIFMRVYYKEPVSSAVFVTNLIFTLSLPPGLPFWMAALGIVFGIIFGKMVFGGFGKNVFNPAMTGRAFIYISFGVQMTSRWVEPFVGYPGGFGAFAADAVSAATPIAKLAQGLSVPKLSLILGNVSGSLGETSSILLVLGGVYLLVKKYASWRIVASGFLGFIVLQTALWLAGVPKAQDPLVAVMAGAAEFGILFVATDPVSASQTNTGRWIYGGLVGALIVLIRTFSVWTGGVMFAVLFGNTFAPIVDYYVKQSQAKGARK